MSDTPYNEPAFPVQSTSTWTAHGMTLRDYFAAKALQGFLAHRDQDYAMLRDSTVPMLASEAYRMADAMLKERAK